MKYDPKTLLKEAFMTKFQVRCKNFLVGTFEIPSGFAIPKATFFDIWLAKVIYIYYGTHIYVKRCNVWLRIFCVRLSLLGYLGRIFIS